MDVLNGHVGHVAGHPDAACRDHVVGALQLRGEHIDTSSEEEVVVLTVEAALADRI